MRSERLGGPQLRFTDHALVTVLHVLDPVLQIAPFIRQLSLDRVGASRHVPFKTIGHEMHGLSDLEPMARHVKPLSSRRWASWTSLEDAGAICGPSRRKLPAETRNERGVAQPATGYVWR